MICNKTEKKSSILAADCLKNGGVVILPTDTVYGFSGIVDFIGQPSFRTDEKIMDIKGRENSKPLIQLISSPEDVYRFTYIKIPDKLISLWPGPLTMVVPVKSDCPLASSMQTIALRCPGDSWLRNIIKDCGASIYSTSVNRSGQKVLDNEKDILEEFSNSADLIVLDGDKKDAKASTLISVSQSGDIKVLRQGSLVI